MHYCLTISAFLLVTLLSSSCSEPEDVRSSGIDHPSIERQPAERESSVPEASAPRAGNVEEYQEAADLVRQYYTAISRGSDRRAFDLWEEGRLTYEAFTAEAESISRAVVTFNEAGRAGTSEGMPTIEVPITLSVTTTDGEAEKRHETFLLRKSPDQGWRIFDRVVD